MDTLSGDKIPGENVVKHPLVLGLAQWNKACNFCTINEFLWKFLSILPWMGSALGCYYSNLPPAHFRKLPFPHNEKMHWLEYLNINLLRPVRGMKPVRKRDTYQEELSEWLIDAFLMRKTSISHSENFFW